MNFKRNARSLFLIRERVLRHLKGLLRGVRTKECEYARPALLPEFSARVKAKTRVLLRALSSAFEIRNF